MQARTILPETFKTAPKPEQDSPRAEKKQGNAFLSLVMERVQPQAVEAAPVPPAPPQPEASVRADGERRSAEAADRGAEAIQKADSAERAARSERDKEIKEKDRRESETSKAEKPREGTDSRAQNPAEHAAVSHARESQRRTDRADHLPRPAATRLHAAFDPRPVERRGAPSAGLEALVTRAMNREQSAAHVSPQARPEKLTQADKPALQPARNSVESPRLVREQTKRPEEQTRLAAERNETRETQKKPEVKEKNVVISVNPEKWTVEHEKREFKEFRGGSQGERRELVRDLREVRESKSVRQQAQPEIRDAAFSELLKAPLQAEPKRAPVETREAFSKLVERARVNVGADGTSTASMRLKPEQLGSVTLNLRVAGSQVEAKLVVESEHVKKMMKEEIEQLAVELKRQGFSVDAIEIRVREPSESSLSFSPDQNSRNADPRSGTGTFAPPVQERADSFEYGESVQRPVHEGAVNLAV